MENVHAHTPHRVRTKEKKFTRGLSSCTRNKRSSQVSFFLSLPSFGVFVEFLHPWKPGGALRRGQMPANSRGACVAQETSSAFFFFWPVFSEFIPHAQTHMHHARTHVHTNTGEAETFHQKGVKTKHSFTVCLWHQHLKGWERRGTTSCTATTTPIFFQPTRTRIPAKGGETKQNRGQGWPPSFSLFLVVVSQSLQLWRECRQPATHCHERHNRDASVAASSR